MKLNLVLFDVEGGAAIAGLELAKVISKKMDITIFTSKINYDTRYKDLNIVSLPNYFNFRLTSPLIYGKKVAKCIKNEKNSIINYNGLGLVCNFYLRNNNSIFTSHGDNWFEIYQLKKYCRHLRVQKIFWSNYVDFIVRQNIKRTQKIITVCKSVKNNFLRYYNYKKEIFVIYNGVDTTHFKPNSKKSDEILFVGKVNYMKGIDILIYAFKNILKKFPNLILRIIGNGSIKYYAKLIKKLNITKNIIMEGKINRTNLPKYYSKAKIFVLPSYIEAFPLVNLEALSCGTPVIASNIGGNPEIIKNNYNGLLLQNFSVRELTEKILYLLENDKERRKLEYNSRKSVEKKFNINRTSNEYLNLLYTHF
ncbi:MAG: glycosyltransferase family 4 protein [Candidatus Helarchaeota archaeon]